MTQGCHTGQPDMELLILYYLYFLTGLMIYPLSGFSCLAVIIIYMFLQFCSLWEEILEGVLFPDDSGMNGLPQ